MTGLRLTPLTCAQERDLAVALIRFFADAATIEAGEPSVIRPASLWKAWAAMRQHESLGASLGFHGPIVDMAQRLAAAGILCDAGRTLGRESPPFDRCYHMSLALTRLQKRGEAWLTSVLGWDHLLRIASPLVCQIVGRNREGDVLSGSGLVLPCGAVVTNAHVLTGMTPESVELASGSYAISSHAAHELYDVGLVRFAPSAPASLNAGLAFRENRSIEPILVVGFPPIPRAKAPALTAQTGETCGAIVEDMSGLRQLLFSAISRPGNSGGPVFARDGRVVGLVSHSLEREREGREVAAPHPFFAAVPALDVRTAAMELDPSLDFPWETWDQ